MIKEPDFIFPAADIHSTINEMDQHEPGPWTVWGDGVEPHLVDVDYDTMKKYVDEGHAAGKIDLYGDNADTNEIYEGE